MLEVNSPSCKVDKMKPSVFLLTVLIASLAAANTFAQANGVERFLGGFWVQTPNATADWLKTNNLNGGFAIEFRTPVPEVFDGPMGDPFQITKIRKIDATSTGRREAIE